MSIVLIKDTIRRIRASYFRSIYKAKPIQTYISNDFGFSRGMPVDRFYIKDFINKHQSIIIGDALEFGGTVYLNKHHSNIQDCYEFHYSDSYLEKDRKIFGDISKIKTLPSSKFDTVICTNVLNFIYDVKLSLEGLHKILKRDGRVILTVAGPATHISRYDMKRWGDYWRFTDQAVLTLAKEAGFFVQDVRVYGNPYACTAQLNGMSIEDLCIKRVQENHEDYQILIGLIIQKKS